MREAVDRVIGDAAADIGLVSLSTTLATNAIVEGQGSPVCLLLIGTGRDALTRAGLGRALAGDPVAFIPGGHAPTGDEQAPLDLDAVRAALEAHEPKVSAIAVAGYFAVRNPEHEHRVRDLARELTGLPVTCAHELSSRLDAPRRALTALLNARLIPLLQELVLAVRGLLAENDVRAPLMVVQGDGSLISAEAALARPVETILSGPAASVVGARYLGDAHDALVVDMGGTTTDIAVLSDGRPVLDEDGATVGGWRTMVEAVAVHTVGLGGDSEVGHGEHGRPTVGPRRVVPLSLLADQHPEALDILRTQLERGASRTHDGRFAMRLRPPDGAGLSAAENRLWEALGDGPAALESLFDREHADRALRRLVARGLVIIAGFTPTDAAHALGIHGAWSADAARLGAALWVRRAADMVRGGDAEDVETACRRVIERVVVASSEAIVAAVLARSEGAALDGERSLGRLFLDRALDKTSAGADPLLDVTLTLRRPLVAIGAPAASYYPAVAERLNTRLEVPPHAEVANAVGAVAGGVMQVARALITAPEAGRFRVHAASGVHDFDDLEDAAACAAREARRLAEAHAREAGAVAVEVTARREDRTVRAGDGHELFLESEITATAAGRPGIAARGS